ncbi:chemotaxis protein CheD [Candidatus Poribacteria bacterium]|nr:chemotaxis protein CheD [Candidatus Poribacteria bacterium]HDO76782.1 chemotaxis protein CheD [Candidatus Poribacteria bacterium]HEX30387.1 chemotaxis protein CheD [Candidatus Poribacteria bacterium]
MKHIVGVADMKISDRRGDILITYALGSCLGIAIYDPEACVGGLLHVMLPLSTIDPEKATRNPFMFVDTGVPKLFIECYKAGAKKERLQVKVAGGASSKTEGEDLFQIGRRNFIILRKLLWRNGVLLSSYDVGGTLSRTMSLEIGTGRVTVKADGITRVL